MKTNPVIYKISSPSNKIYIGQTWDIIQRFKDYNRLHCKAQRKIYNSLCKYGSENHIFEIIHKLPEYTTQEDLDMLEIAYIEYYKHQKYELLNLKEGGSRGKLSQESKDKTYNTKVKNGHYKLIYIYSSITGEFINKEIGYRKIAKILNINESNIRQIITGKMKTCKGYYFSLKNLTKEQVLENVIHNNQKQEYRDKMSIICSGSGNPMFGRKKSWNYRHRNEIINQL